jgi:formamidopyrimidine-DNA glycosylase
MIELPEAVVISRQVEDTLTGKRIMQAVAGASPHKFAWYTGDPADYNERLYGRTIKGAAGYGNLVEVELDDCFLDISTPIKYHEPGTAPPKKHQLLLEFDDFSAITCTVQMWGVMMILAESGEGGMADYQIAKHRPSPLTSAFDEAYFNSLIDRSTTAKEFLATKQRIPGLGNGVLQDILWAAGIHPRRKMSSLSDQEINAMFRAVKDVLAEMTTMGGRDTERDLYDHPGGYKTVLSKYTLGTPCPVCETTIRKEPYLGGVIYFCSTCQALQ